MQGSRPARARYSGPASQTKSLGQTAARATFPECPLVPPEAEAKWPSLHFRSTTHGPQRRGRRAPLRTGDTPAGRLPQPGAVCSARGRHPTQPFTKRLPPTLLSASDWGRGPPVPPRATPLHAHLTQGRPTETRQMSLRPDAPACEFVYIRLFPRAHSSNRLPTPPRGTHAR